MDRVAFFHLQHGRVHSSSVSSVMSLADVVFGGLTDRQMRTRPADGLNSLVWLLWHMARTEDIAVNLIVVNGRQVHDDAWERRIGASRRDSGNGMTHEEVAEFSARADVSAVLAYRDAVGLRTREVVTALAPEAWSEIVAPDASVPVPGGFRPLAGQPRALELGTSAITHNAIHLGEAITIRSLAGAALGR